MSIKINPGVRLGPGTSAKVPVAPPSSYTLTVTLSGTGSGFVTSSPAGINVSSGSASHAFTPGTSVTLNATSAMGSSFSGWAGAASGTGTAHITMDQDQAVGAAFSLNTPIPVSIAVTPTEVMLPVGRSIQMMATMLFSNGSTEDYTDRVLWSSAGFSVVNVASNGIVTGVGPGIATIGAGYGYLYGSTTLTVTSATLVVIGISPPSPAVAQDGTIQLTATGTFSDGSQLDLSAQVLWSSTNGAIASIDANGLATGHSGGNCTIQASLNGVQNSVTLFVGS